MKIKVFKTHEIDDTLWAQIVDGFNESFASHTTVESLKSSFCVRNQFGYAYHAVALNEDGDLMGYNVLTPTLYKRDIKVVVSGSTYVRKKYRKNEMLFMDMINALHKVVIAEGFQVKVGVPNNNSRKFAIKVLKSKYLMDLDYYVMPIHVSKMLKKNAFRSFDWFVQLIMIFNIGMSRIISLIYNGKEVECKYQMETNDSFWKSRFPSPVYATIRSKVFHAYYRVFEEDGCKTAYLMDFREGDKRTYKALLYAVREIRKNNDVDAIMFVGTLRMLQNILIKVPYRFIPKHLPVTFKILDKSLKDRFKDMDNKDNWNFSLMNFDAR